MGSGCLLGMRMARLSSVCDGVRHDVLMIYRNDYAIIFQ